MPFRGLIGHRRLLGLLSRAVARGTLPPSLIFAGPEGVGKRSTALALAQTINCTAPLTASSDVDTLELDACGECVSCRRIERQVHADVMVLQPGPTGSIKVDQVREAIGHTAYRPFEGRRRVIIIDDADALVTEAQNALLKTLEEPPPASVLVLVVARPDVLLPTVRSRCPRLRFGRLSASDITTVLMRDEGCSEAEARAVAVAADGRLGQALRARSGQLGEAREVAHRILRGVASQPEPRRRLETARDLVGRAGSGSADRADVTWRLRALASLLRDVQLLSTRADERLLANADLRSSLEALTGSFDGERVVRAFSAAGRALRALERNASPKVVADWLVFQL